MCTTYGQPTRSNHRQLVANQRDEPPRVSKHLRSPGHQTEGAGAFVGRVSAPARAKGRPTPIRLLVERAGSVALPAVRQVRRAQACAPGLGRCHSLGDEARSYCTSVSGMESSCSKYSPALATLSFLRSMQLSPMGEQGHQLPRFTRRSGRSSTPLAHCRHASSRGHRPPPHLPRGHPQGPHLHPACPGQTRPPQQVPPAASADGP